VRHSYYRDVHYYVNICPDHCLLILDTTPLDATKNEHVHFSS